MNNANNTSNNNGHNAEEIHWLPRPYDNYHEIYSVQYSSGMNGGRTTIKREFSDPAEFAKFYMDMVASHKKDPTFNIIVGARTSGKRPDHELVELARQYCAL